MHTVESVVSKLSNSTIVCMPETAVPGLDSGIVSDGECVSSSKLAARDSIEMAGGEIPHENAITVRGGDPARRVSEVCDTFEGRCERGHRNKADSGARDKEDIVEGEMDPLGNNKSNEPIPIA